MSTISIAPILCRSCNKKFAWKPELAGKRVKCKCGQAILVRATEGAAAATRPPTAKVAKPVVKHVEPDEMGLGLDGLYALAEDAERAAAAMPIEVREIEPAAAIAVPAPRRAANGIPLAYQNAPTAVQQRRAAAAADALVDPVRDYYVPTGLILSGLLMYIAYYATRLHLGMTGIAIAGAGLTVVMLIKTTLLVGAALLLAGPLGVGFGSLWSAILKLAAIAVFTDGCTAWIDYGLQQAGGAGSSGVVGFGVVSWFVSIILYWIGMVQLFGMDIADARLVVACLSVMSFILRWAIIIFVLGLVMGIVGASRGAGGVGGWSATPTVRNTIKHSALTDRVDLLRGSGSLVEARTFIARGDYGAILGSVNDWYACGCKDVSFEMSGGDINGRRYPIGLLVELPTSPTQRRQAYAVLLKYYQSLHSLPDGQTLIDTGESYLEAGLK